MNFSLLVGNLGQDPRITTTDSNFTIAEFSIATQDTKKVGDSYEKITDWTTVKALGKTAELVEKYLQKGSKVGIQGRLKTDSWEKDGEKKYKTYILCDKLEFLSSKGDNDNRETEVRKPVKELDIDSMPF